MIPILYEAGATDFSTNGIGRLSDCVSVRVTEERNSIFEVEFVYPITGEHYDDITVVKIIVITHDESGDKQPFKIYRKSAPISGQCVYNAHHISYALSNVIVEPFARKFLFVYQFIGFASHFGFYHINKLNRHHYIAFFCCLYLRSCYVDNLKLSGLIGDI